MCILRLLLFSVFLTSFLGHFQQASAHLLEGTVETFSIVSGENCRVRDDGTRFRCRFPEIEIRDSRSRHLSIPYETVVKTRVSGSCQLDAVSSALKIRLENQNQTFLRYEDISIDHNYRKVLTHQRSYPFGRLSIYPRVHSIFSDLKFSPDCEITLEVKFNQSALKSVVQADEHVETLIRDLDHLKQAHAMIVELARLRRHLSEERHFRSQVKHHFQAVDHSPASWEDLNFHWKILLSSIRDTLSVFGRGPNPMEELEDLGEQLDGFALQLQEATTPARTTDDLANFVAQSRHNDYRPLSPLLFESNHLDEVAQKLRNAEDGIEVLRRELDSFFSQGSRSLLDEELEELLFYEITGPHGIVDEYLHDLDRIGYTSD